MLSEGENHVRVVPSFLRPMISLAFVQVFLECLRIFQNPGSENSLAMLLLK